MIAPPDSKGEAFRIFREALAGYAFSIAGILAGTIIAFQTDIFSISPWSVAVYPAILSARGIIGGLFSGRLSTALHLGTISPRLFGNTKSFSVLFTAVITVAWEVSIIMSLVSTVAGSFLWGISFSDFFELLPVISATMALGLSIAFVTVEISSISFKRGLDPDVFLYPVVSAISDVFMTLFYILSLSLFFSSNSFGKWIVSLLGLFLAVSALISFMANFQEKEFSRTLKESLFALIIVGIAVNVTGTVLNRISGALARESEVYIVFPALMAVIGDVGAVVGSTATTKLAVGLLNVSLSDLKNHSKEILCAWAASVIMFLLFSFISLSIRGTLSPNSFLRFALMLLITNVIAASATILASYVIAILAFRKGLDPDNFVIPIEAVVADGMTSIGLLAAILLSGLMG